MPGYIFQPRSDSNNRNLLFYWAGYFFTIQILSLFCNVANAQRENIEKLKISLPSFRDSGRIDRLNTLSLAYTYLQPDSAKRYARMAYNEALKINYNTGTVMSLNNSAHIAGLAFHDYALQEKMSLQILQSYQKLVNEKILTDTYLNLAVSLFCQGDFERSAGVCNKIILLCQTTGEKTKLGEAVAILGCISLETGKYEKSFELFNQSLRIFKESKDSFNMAILLTKIGDLYRLAGDQKTALIYYYQSLEFPKGANSVWHPLIDLGDTYYSLGPYDSTMHEQEKFMQTIKSMTIRTNYSVYSRIRESEILINSKDYNGAIKLLKKDLLGLQKASDKTHLMRVLWNISKAYEQRNDIKPAFYYCRQLLILAQKHRANQYLRDGYQLMYSVYERTKRTDSAYHYFRLYTYMKDSVSQDGFSKKLAIYKAAGDNEKKQAQIELLKNEKLISHQQLLLSDQELEDESTKKNLLITGVVLIIIFGIIIIRYILLNQKNEVHKHELEKNELKLLQLESEKTKSELQRQATELEMQALRAQMNPHFIFNSLNSINCFILQNNGEQASEYLTKFSRLVRLILENSQSAFIPLESEIEALRVYIELESVRFEQHFSFEISVPDDIDPACLKVPPLIIQPYVENAIWHGLMHKEEKGHLLISMYQEHDELFCKITDDGIGRTKAFELKSKSAAPHKSMGMQITASRIALLQNDLRSSKTIKITDLIGPDGTARGTEVILNIPSYYD